MKKFALVAPLLLAASTHAQNAPAVQQGGDYYVLDLTSDQGPSLRDLIHMLAQAEELEYELTEAAQTAFDSAEVRLLRPVRVPKDRLFGFLESIVFFAGGTIFLEGERIVVHGPGEVSDEAYYRTLAVDDLPGFAADHPATLVRVTLSLPGAEPRQLTTSLRTLLHRAGVAGLRAVGADGIEVHGPAAEVADLVATIQGAAGRGPEAADLDALLGPASEALSISKEGDLLELLEAYARITGVNLWIDSGTRERLRGVVPGVLVDLEVPPEAVHSAVEAVLAENDLLLAPIRMEEPDLVAVLASSRIRDATVRYLRVDPDALRLHDHPARLVETVVEVEHIDVRQLATSLRVLLADQTVQSLIAVSDDTVVLRGFGSSVASLVRLIRLLDLSMAAEPGPSLPSPILPPPEPFFLAFSSENPPPLAMLLEHWATDTGRSFILGADARRSVAQGAARGPGRVKAEELLVTNDLWTAVLRRAEPEIVAVRREERSRRSASYVVLDADEVDLVAHLVSLRVLVVAPVEQLEPRASATLLRRRRDEFGLDLLLAGGTRRIVVCGRVAEVIPFLVKLRAWDEAGTIPD